MKTIPHRTAKELFGGEEPATTTRDRLIETALNLFYRYGFHAVGLDRILTDAGLTKTTFYNHFESKEDLIIAAIRRRDQWETQTFARMIQERAGYDPRAMLLAMFDVLEEWFTSKAFLGCLYINACAEFPSPHDPVHHVAAEHYREAERTIRQLADAAGADDPAALAEQMVLLIQGALTRRMVTRDDTAAAGAKEAAELLLKRHLPPGSSESGHAVS